jgi:hypothetical protein
MKHGLLPERLIVMTAQTTVESPHPLDQRNWQQDDTSVAWRARSADGRRGLPLIPDERDQRLKRTSRREDEMLSGKSNAGVLQHDS